MSDLVERLYRASVDNTVPGAGARRFMGEAAGEINRLRALLARAEEALEKTADFMANGRTELELPYIMPSKQFEIWSAAAAIAAEIREAVK